jgi:hypothetical protein
MSRTGAATKRCRICSRSAGRASISIASTMRLIVRKPECLDDGIAERSFKQGTTVILAPLMMCTWSYSKLRQFVGKA